MHQQNIGERLQKKRNCYHNTYSTNNWSCLPVLSLTGIVIKFIRQDLGISSRKNADFLYTETESSTTGASLI